MNRLARGAEQCGGILLGAVALITVIEVVLRQLFGLQLPDAYTLAGYLQGIAIFWGIAIALLVGRHITVDILWVACPPWLRTLIDMFAMAISVLAMTALTYMMARKVLSSYHSGEATYELGMLVWPLMFLATAGAGFAILFSALRLRQLSRQLFDRQATSASRES